jgi:preprotein translocase subunit SecF
VRPLRLVPDNTTIPFMRGRFAGVIVSAILSIGSIILFFYPGLNYNIDFRGGVVAEVRFPAPADAAVVRAGFLRLGYGEASVQQFGTPRDMLIKLDRQAEGDNARTRIQALLAAQFPGSDLRRIEVVGAKVSGELFSDGLKAIGLALLGILGYIWFRFDWQFGVGIVATLLLDATKTIGFYAVTRMPFDLNSVAALMILIGFSVTDKVVVYDRIRENLRKYKSTPLRQVIDQSINQTLSRTVATSLTVLLSILPLAIIAKGSVQNFAVTMVFGIVIGTSSSIFIASPILLFLGQKRLRPAQAEAAPASNPAALVRPQSLT